MYREVLWSCVELLTHLCMHVCCGGRIPIINGNRLSALIQNMYTYGVTVNTERLTAVNSITCNSAVQHF